MDYIFNSGQETPDTKQKKEAQLSKLQKNASHIRKLINLTKDVKSPELKIISDEPIKLLDKKPNIFYKIKNYFKKLFFKYLIEPQLKKILEQEKVIKLEKENSLIEEIKKNIYDTKTYERERYYQALTKTRKESGGYICNKTPLFVDTTAIAIHNMESFEGKPSMKALLTDYKNEAKEQFMFYEKRQERLNRILSNKNQKIDQ